MSVASRSVLVSSFFVAGGIIYYVHWKQDYDRSQSHLGVVRDLERQARRKTENLYQLEQQAVLTRVLRKEQQKEDLKEFLQQPAKVETAA